MTKQELIALAAAYSADPIDQAVLVITNLEDRLESEEDSNYELLKCIVDLQDHRIKSLKKKLEDCQGE